MEAPSARASWLGRLLVRVILLCRRGRSLSCSFHSWKCTSFLDLPVVAIVHLHEDEDSDKGDNDCHDGPTIPEIPGEHHEHDENGKPPWAIEPGWLMGALSFIWGSLGLGDDKYILIRSIDLVKNLSCILKIDIRVHCDGDRQCSNLKAKSTWFSSVPHASSLCYQYVYLAIKLQ